jgi:hypothetical protein
MLGVDTGRYPAHTYYMRYAQYPTKKQTCRSIVEHRTMLTVGIWHYY